MMLCAIDVLCVVFFEVAGYNFCSLRLLGVGAVLKKKKLKFFLKY